MHRLIKFSRKQTECRFGCNSCLYIIGCFNMVQFHLDALIVFMNKVFLMGQHRKGAPMLLDEYSDLTLLG